VEGEEGGGDVGAALLFILRVETDNKFRTVQIHLQFLLVHMVGYPRLERREGAGKFSS
jgi:hypothetical protein